MRPQGTEVDRDPEGLNVSTRKLDLTLGVMRKLARFSWHSVQGDLDDCNQGEPLVGRDMGCGLV